MEDFSARLNALEQGVRERDAHIQHLNNMLTQQQTALQAQSSGTSVTQPDLHREMLGRVKEFDGDDDKWPGWWFKLQSFLIVNQHRMRSVDRENRARDGGHETDRHRVESRGQEAFEFSV